MINKQLHEDVKDRMIKKFGTIGRFCRCTGIDRVQVQKDFYCEKKKPNGQPLRTERFNLYSRLIKETSPISDPKTISVELRGKIDKAINDLGGVVKFCKDNPEFKSSNVYGIISGRRVKITEQVSELINFLGVG